jgi:hypothetical protein
MVQAVHVARDTAGRHVKRVMIHERKDRHHEAALPDQPLGLTQFAPRRLHTICHDFIRVYYPIPATIQTAALYAMRA